MPDKHTLDPRFIAALDLIRRSGALSVQVRYSDDEQPVVWMVVAEHKVDRRGLPTSGKAEPSSDHHTVGAGLNPVRAALMCAERLIDGRQCAHCLRPSALDTEEDGLNIPFACMVRYNATVEAYEQGCAGRSPVPADAAGFDVT